MEISANGIVYADSTMSGMPSLNNTAGSLIAVLDAVLPTAGFTKAFSGTHKAAYRSDDVEGSRLFCRIDDSYGGYARIRGYEAMDDVDTVTSGYGVFPTDAQQNGGGYIYKADGTPRSWKLYSDGRMIYFFCDTFGDGTTWWGGFVFGDIDSYAINDNFCCLVVSGISTTGVFKLSPFDVADASYLSRPYTQTGTSTPSRRYSHRLTTQLGNGGQAYPAPADTSIHLWPVECWENNTLARGIMPGLWNPIHNSSAPHGLEVDNIPNLPGRTLKVQTTGNVENECAIDLTGPWR